MSPIHFSPPGVVIRCHPVQWRVIELVRTDRRITQTAPDQALGMSQSALFRLEKNGTAAYSTGLPARLPRTRRSRGHSSDSPTATPDPREGRV
ncbi:hypothetical protein ACFY0B_02970 [Streptomyces sp. NPDC001797]|uniref:hypothetical protein n=1 Tax=Streptomyces sp. NPDC001797 TaxID=3364610 RepID=UPI00369E847C